MAYTETAAANVKPTTALSAIEDFDAVLGRLEMCVSKASDAADKIVGGRPTGVDGKENAPSPQHLIAQIQDRRSRLVRAVDHLESEVTRILNGV